MTESFDLIVVGAGPGGLAAAATAAEAGMRVCIVDDNPTCGGQIWRGTAGEESTKGTATKWLERVRDRVSVRSGWTAVDSVTGLGKWRGTLRTERDAQTRDICYSALVLATGARELFLPFPGWTLPGVYGAGGLQAFVKSGLDVSGKRIVVAGTGPLLLAVSAGLTYAGARIVAIVEQAPLSRLARFSLSLLWGHAGKLIEGAGYGWSTRGIPYLTGEWVNEASGDGHVQSVTVTSGSRVRDFKTDMLAIGFHLIANIELARLLNCVVETGFVCVDSMQQTSVKGIYCVGEATGIGGIEKALLEGQIAGFAAAGRLDRAKEMAAARDRRMRFARRLNSTFALRTELRTLARDETIVCRCEDVPNGSLRDCRTWREAKLHTRCGMGPCQGRICGPATQFLYGWDSPQPRPPLFPTDVSVLAEQWKEDARSSGIMATTES